MSVFNSTYRKKQEILELKILKFNGWERCDAKVHATCIYTCMLRYLACAYIFNLLFKNVLIEPWV